MLRQTLNIDPLVNEILDRIPNLIHGRFIDPSMGGGQFMKEVERRKKEAGLSLDMIRKTCYGYVDDEMDLNYVRNKFKLVGQYKVGNALEENICMKFGAVIGNPPYQEMKDDNERKDKSSNLWSKFISLGLNISEKDGHVAMITPNSWLSPSADLKGSYVVNGQNRLWDVFNSYSTYANVVDVAKHFKGVGSTFGYFSIDKSGHAGLQFSDGADTSLGFLPKSGRDDCVKNLHRKKNLHSLYKIDQENSPGWRVSVPASRNINANSVEILSGDEMPSTGSKNHRLYVYVYASSKSECVKIRNRIIECQDILNTHCRWSGFVNIQTLKMIRV